ncbi:hypothetical protein EII31_03390 [Leucobacter sp. OH2974_COT-288]|nr:hypothetical protein EII31_03390 [Leucobacter sp. OH2974_COT-288]
MGNDAAAVAADAETPKAPAKRRGRPRKVDVEQAAAEQAAASEEKAAADGGDTAETAAGATAEQPQETRGRSRTRQRDRKRRGADEIEELTEDDVLLPIAGILDVLDNYAFVRTSGYLPGVSDVYVSLSQVKRHGLRKGDAIVGAIRKPREGEGSGRQKYNALVKIDAVNGTTVEEAQQRPQFEELTPIAPNTPVLIGDAVGTATARAIDMFAPLAFGQRGLLNGASGSGVTATLLEIAAGYAAVSPETHLMFVAVGGRPEETTEIARRINGEVIAAAADRSAEDRTTVVELALERAKRLVEIGHDVVLLLDTLADFSDAIETQTYNPKTSPIFGMNPYTMQLIVDVFAASRNLENSGSLAVYAGVYGVRMFADMERLQRLQNWNLELNSELAQLGVFPAVNVLSSSAKVAAAAHPAALAQQVRQIRMAQHSAGEGDVSAAVELIETLENAESTAAAAAKLSAKK